MSTISDTAPLEVGLTPESTPLTNKLGAVPLVSHGSPVLSSSVFHAPGTLATSMLPLDGYAPFAYAVAPSMPGCVIRSPFVTFVMLPLSVSSTCS